MDVVLMGSVFLAGLLSFFSPCVLPLFPVYLGVLASDEGKYQVQFGRLSISLLPVLKTGAFVTGISTIFFVLGFAATWMGHVLYHPLFPIILGGIIVLLGLHQMEVFQLKFLLKQKAVSFGGSGASIGRSYLLGLSFSFGWTPCIGPVLSAVLALVATGQVSHGYVAFLLALYSVGLSLPFLVLSVASSSVVRYFHQLKQQLPLFKKIGGLLIVGMGIWMMVNR